MKIIHGKDVPLEDRGGYLVKKMLSEKINSCENNLDGMIQFLTVVLKGKKCKEQYHAKSYETVFFLDAGIGIINGQKYNFEAGDNLFLEPGDRHEFLAIENDLRLYAVRVPNLPEDKINTY